MPSGNRSPTPNQADRGSTRQQRGHCSSSTRPIWTRDRCVRWCECVIRHRSEEHTSELQSLMRISYAVFCLKKKTNIQLHINKIKQVLDRKLQHASCNQYNAYTNSRQQ